jgi:hypothetical protein
MFKDSKVNDVVYVVIKKPLSGSYFDKSVPIGIVSGVITRVNKKSMRVEYTIDNREFNVLVFTRDGSIKDSNFTVFPSG